MRLGNKSIENDQNSKLLGNIMLQLKSWKIHLFLQREWVRPFIIQDMPYDYKKNNKK